MQKPLATVVIVGIVFGTMITLTVFPGLLKVMLRGYVPAGRTPIE